ncbi:MAG: glycosyltransferase family 2 protein [Schwartzia sp.]|nr:glycosyltransferase family 2 protein [Schwartzia sp. (in: firmicutes)]
MGEAIKRANALPLVSIMIPTYNRPEMFALTLESALSQTYPNVEVLVTDNSTNEETAELMKYYANEPRLTYLRNREAKTKAENFAPFERLAKGEYLQWLMDDDILAPDKLQRMMNVFLAHPNLTLVTSQRGMIDGEGNEIGIYCPVEGLEGEYQIYSGEKAGRTLFFSVCNYIGEPSAVLFRRRDLVHHYWRADSRGYVTLSDVAMWLELLEKGDFAIFTESLSWYRNHGGQEGKNPDVVLNAFLEWESLITEHFERKAYLKTREDYKNSLRRLREVWIKFEPVLLVEGSAEMLGKYRERVVKIDKVLSGQDEII